MSTLNLHPVIAKLVEATLAPKDDPDRIPVAVAFRAVAIADAAGINEPVTDPDAPLAPSDLAVAAGCSHAQALEAIKVLERLGYALGSALRVNNRAVLAWTFTLPEHGVDDEFSATPARVWRDDPDQVGD